MHRIFIVLVAAAFIAGCDDAKESADETVRDVTGANMIEQGKAVQQQLHQIDQQQKQRFEQLDEQ
ncbi:MAG TPA: hypothetical protein VKA94_02050 [Hyphomicrobiales bacterium]|nr:hypothetical protein [Hyphomicrobiales bacterium]